MKDDIYEVKITEGHCVATRIIRKGETYGKSNTNIHSGENPIIEYFYSGYKVPDITIIKDNKIIAGCYIGETYPIQLFFEERFTPGVILNAPWALTLSKSSMLELREWIDNQLTEEEKNVLNINFDKSSYEETEEEQSSDDFDMPYSNFYSNEYIEQYTEKRKAFKDQIKYAVDIINSISQLENKECATNQQLSLIRAKEQMLLYKQSTEEEQKSHKDFLLPDDPND